MTRLLPSPAVIFATLALLLPPLGLYAPKALVVVSALAALLLLPHRAARETFVADLRAPLALVLAALLLWAAATTLWSPDPTRAIRLLFSVFAIVLGGALLLAGGRSVNDDGRRQLENALMGGGLLFLALALVEGATSGAILRGLRGEIAVEALSRGSAILAILLPLYALVFQRRFGAMPGLAIAALGLVALLLLPMFAAFIAGVFALLVALAVRAAPRSAARALAIGGALLILLAPLLANTLADPEMVKAALPGLPTNFLHRFHIWSFAGERILDRPLLGWGLDAARGLPGGDRMAGLQSVLPLHPHNAALQVWVELGAIGAILATGVWLLVCRRLGRTGWTGVAPAAGAASMAAWFAVAHLSYGIWQNWWLALPWVVAALFTATVPRQNDAKLAKMQAPGDTP